jgi:hypothetical protein
VHLNATNGYGVITYYVNGVNRGTFTEASTWNSWSIIQSGSAFYVGKYSYMQYRNSTSESALHRINYLRLFSDELSETEVRSYYTSGE